MGYARIAKDTGRKFVMYDVDTPLENSLVGVLDRRVGGNNPLVPYDPVATGFADARRNRSAVIEWFLSHPEASYKLYGTTPDGAKLEALAIEGGKVIRVNEQMLQELITPPGEEMQVLGKRVITQESIDEIVAKIHDPQYAAGLRNKLQPYIGKTWEQALNQHSLERPRSVQ